MADQLTFLPILEGQTVERTQATYYTSDLYTKPLTPEHILGCKNHWQIERGQIPYPTNRWTSYDAWYMTNHWIHRINDKYVFGMFGWAQNGLHDTTIDDQPYPHSYMCRRNPYDDDIPGQVAAAAIVGAQIGVIFGVTRTQNLAKESGIYQSMGMPNNRWLPLHKANWRYRSHIMMTCMVQSMTFLSAYALADGALCQFRQTDDFWNCVTAGVCAGTVQWIFYNKPFNTIPAGLWFGLFMALQRFSVNNDATPKLCLDFDRPGYGVFGGMPMWFAAEEPNPDTIWYSLFTKRTSVYSP